MEGGRMAVCWRGTLASCRRCEGLGVRVRASAVAGGQWSLIGGARSQLSQLSLPDTAGRHHLALPIDVAYATDTPTGWPQLVLTVYGTDSKGSEAVIGYGRTHFPTTPGERSITVPLFAPESVSPFGSFISWITGKTPELKNPDSLAEGTDNYLLRTTSCGFVDLTLNTITRGLTDLGYDNVPCVGKQDYGSEEFSLDFNN